MRHSDRQIRAKCEAIERAASDSVRQKKGFAKLLEVSGV